MNKRRKRLQERFDDPRALKESNWLDRLVIVRYINATEFKAKCLAILDEVKQTGERVVILKHGKPVGQLSPAVESEDPIPQDSLAGTVKVLGDILEPPLSPEEWEATGSPQK